ncbi:MAG: glycerol-3-phosphate dehydrogenase [Pelagibacteraceae bacterium TMED237]|nr:MAG: glycerol-3-phosphate dehydrogenase [Pelagibacteraceae bacterium TMED237]|tara:strand:- start:5309 stop:6460 length:1152 start_codon:yes stop_codon:yes gene_type:complete
MNDLYDILIIGAGINGAGIARDASGRNLKVCIVEQNEIGSATSSWSTKLIHGGLRYLENYEFRLVRESLKEREIIKKIAKDIVKPIPFIIPHTPSQRSIWIIKFGLLLYDLLGGKSSIPKSKKINISSELPNILKDNFKIGFKYYDLQVDDKKLVELNINDAKKRGATIIENNKVKEVLRHSQTWSIKLEDNTILNSKILINATGPWINDVLKNIIKLKNKKSIRLVKGSHIITNKLYLEDYAFTLQNNDNRIVFVIPYKKKYTLIGTTEKEVFSPDNPKIEKEEIEYLIKTVNHFLKKQLNKKDIIDTFSGIRPLIEDFKEASKLTRDYAFDLNTINKHTPLLSIYGGKLTTYRKLSENVINYLKPFLSIKNSKNWTDTKVL